MTTRTRVLIVDDETEMRRTLSDLLELHEEFEILQAGSGAQALECITREHVDLVLLDIGLPDMDGREVCRLIRRKGIHVPIIILTAREGDADAILGLDSGANDYVIKPFHMGVLLARMRAHLRQHEHSEGAAFALGPYTFRPSARVLVHNKTRKEISLSDKENSILKHLYRAGDTVVGCETLYSEIWDHNQTLATHTLQTHIYRLRQKIEENPAKPVILVSELGGYRIVR